MELFTLGIDLAKTTFHLVGMNQLGEVVGAEAFVPRAAVALHREPKSGTDRYGSLWWIAFPGSCVARTGS